MCVSQIFPSFNSFYLSQVFICFILFFRSFDPYLGVTAHYISKHWSMEKLLVHCGPAPGKHTAVLIAEKLDNVLKSLSLEPDMFTAMTTDNAANMLNAVSKESKNITQGLGCLDHLLQLVINKAIDKVPAIKSAVQNFRKLATSTHKSSLALQRIKKACGDLDRSADGPKGRYN